MDGKLCRVCATAADYKHCVALFSSLNLKNDLPGRMSRLLGVPVCQHDGRPSVICRRCMNNVTGLEKSLDALRKKLKSLMIPLTKKMRAGRDQRTLVGMLM